MHDERELTEHVTSESCNGRSVLRSARGHELHFEELLHLQPLRLRIRQEDGDVRSRRMRGGPRLARLHLDVDVRMRHAERCEPRHEQFAREEWRHQHAQPPSASPSGDLREAAVERLEQWLHVFEQCVAGGGEIQRSRLALEQRDAERLFELLDLVAHGGRREEQLVRRHLEAAMARSVRRDGAWERRMCRSLAAADANAMTIPCCPARRACCISRKLRGTCGCVARRWPGGARSWSVAAR